MVVMDPNNGDLLALVSRPGFDSNKFITGFQDELPSSATAGSIVGSTVLREVAVWHIPGSILRHFLRRLSRGGNPRPRRQGLQPGLFRNERLYPNYTLDDTAPPGDYDFVRAFKRSSNTYFIHYALTPDDRTDQWQQGKRILLDWGNRFRLGKKTIQPWAIAGDELPSPIREGEGYFPPRGNEFKKVTIRQKLALGGRRRGEPVYRSGRSS